jgi:Protein of unknown function (DUF1116)
MSAPRPAEALAEALKALDRERVAVRGVLPARAVVPELDNGLLLHAGPPLMPDELAGPLLKAAAGTLVLDGQVPTCTAAYRELRSGRVRLRPAHECGGVVAAAGVVSASTPVVVVARGNGAMTFSPLSEGAGRTLRFGCWDERIAANLEHMRDEVAPVLNAAFAEAEVEVTGLIAASLRRGDEGHGRTVAGRDLLLAALGPALARTCPSTGRLSRVLAWVAGNRHFFNTFCITAAKALADAAAVVQGSPLVTAIASNGVRLGIRADGISGEWFVAPAPAAPDAARVHPLIGDSFAAEVAGFGCAALRAAPAAASYLGFDQAKATRIVAGIRSISASASTRFLVPADDFTGTPLGLDLRAIVDRQAGPVVSAATISTRDGVGQAGATLASLPVAPFAAALAALQPI